MMKYFALYPDDLQQRQHHLNKSLGDEPCIHDHVIIHDSHIGAWTELGPRTHISESTFGDYSYAAGDASIVYADIGKFCSIASHVRINPGNHPMWRVTQHHMTYRRKQYGFGDDDHAFFDWRRSHRCVIGHDVWIGHGAVVMPGISIGHGAVIGAGAVVTKDVEPYAVAVGVSARTIRKRFPEPVIERLLKIAWWDWDRAALEARFDELLDVESFVAKYQSVV